MQATKEKSDKIDFIKIKGLCPSKDTTENVETTKCEKTFANQQTFIQRLKNS